MSQRMFQDRYFDCAISILQAIKLMSSACQLHFDKILINFTGVPFRVCSLFLLRNISFDIQTRAEPMPISVDIASIGLIDFLDS